MLFPKPHYIPIEQIQSLPVLASHCVPSTCPTMDKLPDAIPLGELALREAPGQAIATPPVVCELCHQGFRCKEDLVDHCNHSHGNYAEYRKCVFFLAQKAGLRPLLPWVKRSLLQSHAFFHLFSIPGKPNDWNKDVHKAVPRRMEACAICAVKDWIENRSPMYLFAEPDSIVDEDEEDETGSLASMLRMAFDAQVIQMKSTSF